MKNRAFFMVILIPVVVLLGLTAPATGGGLSAAGNQLWSQDSPGISGTAETDDLFGQSLAEGDFNGDGYADLAVGVPDEDVGSLDGAGAVNILYGSSTGLSATGNQIWHQNSPSILEGAEENDQFGSALAAGDFNGDGYADLAVGVPDEDLDSVDGAGAVNILYGSSTGLSATGNQIWHQGSPCIWGSNDEYDGYGSALAAGDFNGDGYADLAVGVPGEDAGGMESAGRVNVIYGSATGLTYTGNQTWQEGSGGLVGRPSYYELFGDALAAGDFNHDGYADLAVGVPGENGPYSIGPLYHFGSVYILLGSATGLTATSDEIVDHNREENDRFGAVLATGDFNRDGYADLAVGVPREDIGTINNAGVVNIIYGSSDGLGYHFPIGNQMWHQDSPGILGGAEENDKFGSALAAGDFDADGYADLAMGVKSEDISTIPEAGAVNVIYGSAAGLTATGNQIWYQGKDGILDTAEGGDTFGISLAAGDFNGNSCADLAVGVYGEDFKGSVPILLYNAGVVNVLYGYPDAMPWLMLLLDN